MIHCYYIREQLLRNNAILLKLEWKIDFINDLRWKKNLNCVIQPLSSSFQFFVKKYLQLIILFC